MVGQIQQHADGPENKITFPLIVLEDFNASIGSVTSAGIGSRGESEEDANGKDLRLLIGKSALMPLPPLTVYTRETISLTHPLATTIHARIMFWLTKVGNMPSPLPLLKTELTSQSFESRSPCCIC